MPKKLIIICNDNVEFQHKAVKLFSIFFSTLKLHPRVFEKREEGLPVLRFNSVRVRTVVTYGWMLEIGKNKKTENHTDECVRQAKHRRFKIQLPTAIEFSQNSLDLRRIRPIPCTLQWRAWRSLLCTGRRVFR